MSSSQWLTIAGGATAGIAEYVRGYLFRLSAHNIARDNGEIVVPPEPKFDWRVVLCSAFLGALTSSPFAVAA